MSLSISSVFDANFYRAVNSDLAGLNDAQALSHFQTYGLNEGRSFSPLIDLSFYRASNSDLANFNNSQLLDHLENYGVAEGRNFSPIVDLNYYRANNSDLASLNNEQLFNHLENNGISEGRYFDPLFSFGQYKSLNSDLANFNNSQLLNHFEINGINEGRYFSPYFDFNYYRANNIDLANFNNSQLLQHFEINGINEGRKSSPSFDASFYKGNNPDLASLTGINLLEHFDFYGKFEGRQAASEYAGNTFDTAPQLTIGSNPTQVFEHVGSSDSNDYYQFSLNQASTVTLDNYSFSRSVVEQIVDSNDITQGSSSNSAVQNPDSSVVGNPSLKIIGLAPGTYYIQIQPQAGNTDYQFYLTATPTDDQTQLSLLDSSITTGAAGAAGDPAPQLTIGSNPTQVFGLVGSSDPNNYYQFTLNQASTVTLDNYNFSTTVVQIVDSNDQILDPSNSALQNPDGSVISDPSLQFALDPGTYYIKIQPQPGDQVEDTDYQFDLTATLTDPDLSEVGDLGL
ncbi:hypothetical protein [Nostoc sp.]|uniref:hypothetical protein n=1 Tax=Nostoc sp. TaxID=1180 RepID=UPI002FF8B3EE